GSAPPTWLARFHPASPRSPRHAWPPWPPRRGGHRGRRGPIGLPRPEEELSISLRPAGLCFRISFKKFRCKALFKSHLPLVGNKAPDFEAEAVFDEEFIKVAECLTQLQSHSC
ncbi:unnamed protein product, partial [Musa hybrid cultivar]